MALESPKELRAARRGACQIKKGSQRRAIGLLPAISAAGKLLCSILIVKDSSFKEGQLVQVSHVCGFKILTAKLTLDGRLFLWIGPSTLRGRRHLMEKSISDALLPAMRRERAAVIAEAGKLPWEKDVLLVSEDRAVEADDCAPLIISFDGEQQYLNAMLESYTTLIADDPTLGETILLKYAASCSKTQQPADVAPVFMVQKTIAQKKVCSLAPDVDPPYMGRVEMLLKSMKSASRKTYLDFIRHVEDFLETSFPSYNIRQGWRVAGIWPHENRHILGRCPTFQQLDEAQREAILASISKLAPRMLANGQLTDVEIQAAVGAAVDLDGLLPVVEDDDPDARKSKKPLHQLVINRRRALLLTSATIPKLGASREDENAELDASEGNHCMFQDGVLTPRE